MPWPKVSWPGSLELQCLVVAEPRGHGMSGRISGNPGALAALKTPIPGLWPSVRGVSRRWRWPGSGTRSMDTDVLLSDDGEVAQVERLTREWAEALAEGDDRFTDCFGIPVVAGWIGFAEMRPRLVDAVTAGQGHDWGPHLVFGDEGALVGFAGWKGPPVAGAAELGYAVAPARRGRGIATAVVRELIARARAKGLGVVVAHTLAEESASTAVLKHSGFRKVAELVDPDDGRIWRWELTFDGEPPSSWRTLKTSVTRAAPPSAGWRGGVRSPLRSVRVRLP